MLATPEAFFSFFYDDDAEWTQLQHRERGDKHIRTEKWRRDDEGRPGARTRSRSFQSPFETALLSGSAGVEEQQTVVVTAEQRRMLFCSSVSMTGDVPYCDCYRVLTLLEITAADKVSEGIVVRCFMGADFVRWTLFEARIKQMVASHGAESWEAWEEQARGFLERGDDGDLGSQEPAPQPQEVYGGYQEDRDDTGADVDSESLHTLFLEFFAAVSDQTHLGLSALDARPGIIQLQAVQQLVRRPTRLSVHSAGLSLTAARTRRR